LELLKQLLPTPACFLVTPPRNRTTLCPVGLEQLRPFVDQDVWDGCVTRKPVLINGKYHILFRSQNLAGSLTFALNAIHDSLQTIVDRYLDHPDQKEMVTIGRHDRYDEADYNPEAEAPIAVLVDRLDHLKLILANLPEFPSPDESDPEVIEEWMGHIQMITSHLVRLFDADFLTASLPPAMALALQQEIGAFRRAIAEVLITVRDNDTCSWASSRTVVFSIKGARIFQKNLHFSEETYADFLVSRIIRETLKRGRIVRQAIENAREFALLGLPPYLIAALAIDDLYGSAAMSVGNNLLKFLEKEQTDGVSFDEKFSSDSVDPDDENSTIDPKMAPLMSEASPGVDHEVESADQFRAILRTVKIDSLERLWQINENLPFDLRPLHFIPEVLRNHWNGIGKAQRALDLVSGYSGEKGQHQVSEKERLELSGTLRYERAQNDRFFGIWLSGGDMDSTCMKQLAKSEARLKEVLEKWEPC
jgi:hypothetical protein